LKKYNSHLRAKDCSSTRETLGIPAEAIVYGIVGSLDWVKKNQYCYGSELVRARNKISPSADLYIIIVGDGSGTPELQRLAGDLLGSKIILTGNIPNDRVFEYLAAMDVASLPQSVDGVGSFRYTTKVSEYLATELPIVIGQIPMTYDLLADWCWCLPGKNPWDDRYIDALAQLMATLNREQIMAKTQYIPAAIREFNLEQQQTKVTKFIGDILG
jgi:glycosyltransferase involved in cell wall biosynthesis